MTKRRFFMLYVPEQRQIYFCYANETEYWSTVMELGGLDQPHYSEEYRHKLVMDCLRPYMRDMALHDLVDDTWDWTNVELTKIVRRVGKKYGAQKR